MRVLIIALLMFVGMADAFAAELYVDDVQQSINQELRAKWLKRELMDSVIRFSDHDLVQDKALKGYDLILQAIIHKIGAYKPYSFILELSLMDREGKLISKEILDPDLSESVYKKKYARHAKTFDAFMERVVENYVKSNLSSCEEKANPFEKLFQTVKKKIKEVPHGINN